MLNGIGCPEIEILQVKAVLVVVLAQEVGREFESEAREGRRESVGFVHLAMHVRELDVFSITR